MASTNSVGSTYKGASYEDYMKEQRTAKTQLGKNDFLNLLVAQMKYQDPLEPTKDSDFIAQLAQFSSLEQMENMSSSMLAMQAQSLVGKYVIAPDVMFEDGSLHTVEGQVNSVIYKDGEHYAQIGDAFVKVSKISEVYDRDFVSPENKLADSAHLIGCTVKGYTVDEKGETLYDKSKPIKDDKGEPVYDTTKPILDENGKPKLGPDGKPLYEPLYEVLASEGVVTGLGIKNGVPVAYVKKTDGTEAIVPVSLIFDIRGTAASTTPTPQPEPEETNTLPRANGTIITGNDTETPPNTNPPETGGNTGGTIITGDENTNQPTDGGDTEGNGGGGGIIITP